jgi:hypothetical protein
MCLFANNTIGQNNDPLSRTEPMSGRSAAWERLSAWLVCCVCVWSLVSAIHHGWLGGRGNAAATFYCICIESCMLFATRSEIDRLSARDAPPGSVSISCLTADNRKLENLDDVTFFTINMKSLRHDQYSNLTQFPLKVLTAFSPRIFESQSF